MCDSGDKKKNPFVEVAAYLLVASILGTVLSAGVWFICYMVKQIANLW